MCLFFRPSKAFNTADHNILQAKLEYEIYICLAKCQQDFIKWTEDWISIL